MYRYACLLACLLAGEVRHAGCRDAGNFKDKFDTRSTNCANKETASNLETNLPTKTPQDSLIVLIISVPLHSITMTSRRIVSTEKTVLDKDDMSSRGPLGQAPPDILPGSIPQISKYANDRHPTTTTTMHVPLFLCHN